MLWPIEKQPSNSQAAEGTTRPVKWFQVDGDTPNDPKMKALMRRGVAANASQSAIGAVFLLWCFIAWHGEGEPGEGVRHDGRALNLQDMADECLFSSVDELKALLDHLAERGHIDPDRWRDGVVFLPAMNRRGLVYLRSKGRLPGAKGEKVATTKAQSGAGRAPSGHHAGTERAPGGTVRAPGGGKTPLQDTTEQDATEQNQGQGLPFDSETTAAKVLQLWNAERKPGPLVRLPVDAKRMKNLAAVVRTYPDLADWRLVVRFINSQPWANAPGDGDHAEYRLPLDLLLRPGKFGAMLDRARMAPAAGTAGGRNAAKGRTGAVAGEFSAAMVDEGVDDDATG